MSVSTHHPDLYAYALGLCEPDESLAIEEQLQRDPHLRAALRDVEHALAQLGPATTPSVPSSRGREQLLQDVDISSGLPGFVPRVASMFDIPQETAKGILQSALDPSRWSAFVPGVTLMHFQGGSAIAGADAGFVKLETGALLPRHEHEGEERQLVLFGALEDDRGERCFPGDLWIRSAGTQHSFRALGDTPCIAAVVLYVGIHFVAGTDTVAGYTSGKR